MPGAADRSADRRDGKPPKLNSNWVRKINAAQVLQALRDHPGASQRAVGQVTGLDKATVSTVVGQLAAAGLIAHGSRVSSGRQGRPEVALSIPASAGSVVGALLEPGRIELIAADLAGKVLVRDRMLGGNGVDDMITRLAAGLGGLMRRGKGGPILALGVGVPALIDGDGRLLVAPNLGWRDLPINGLLSDHLPYPVIVENDTNAAAVAERRFGSCRSVDDFVYVAVHSGVGGALFLGGSLYRGAGGLAGEIGHIEVVENGRRCGCGARGCLEAYLSEPALRSQLLELGVAVEDTTSIARLAAAGHPVVRSLLDTTGHRMAKAIAALTWILGPSRVVLGGDLAPIAQYLLPPCLRRLEARASLLPRIAPTLTLSPLGRDAVAMGGVALALDEAERRLLDGVVG